MPVPASTRVQGEVSLESVEDRAGVSRGVPLDDDAGRPLRVVLQSRVND